MSARMPSLLPTSAVINYPCFFFTFCRNCIRNFADMSTIVEVSEDLQRLLGDGGLKPATLTRKRFYDEVYIFFLCCL